MKKGTWWVAIECAKKKKGRWPSSNMGSYERELKGGRPGYGSTIGTWVYAARPSNRGEKQHDRGI